MKQANLWLAGFVLSGSTLLSPELCRADSASDQRSVASASVFNGVAIKKTISEHPVPVGLGVLGVGLVALGGVVLLRRRRPATRKAHARPNHAVVEPEPVMPPAVLKPKRETSLVGLKRSAEMVGKAANNNNHNNNGNHHQNGVRRKKVFDYNRYFTDLMSAVSSNNHFEPAATNGHSHELDRISAVLASQEPANGSTHPANGHSEMISHQKTLIEEQKRLIQEQTRLIEEKSRLIAEKNQLLKMQSEWIDSKVL